MKAVYNPQRQCYKKKSFRSRRVDRDVLSKMHKYLTDDQMKAYNCPHCGLWHIGHRPKFNIGVTDVVLDPLQLSHR